MVDKITTHVDRAKALILDQLQQKPNFEGVIEIFATKVQEIEDMMFNLLEDRWIDTAVGEQLDRLGEILGEERLGRSDVDYRAALSARILINTTSGEPESMIAILQALTGAATVTFLEFYPAGVEIAAVGATTLPPALHANMGKVKPAGVQLILIYNGDTVPFVFSGDTDGAGFADVGFTSGAGTFSEVLT